MASAEGTTASRHWSISEYVCHAGPGDRPFEEAHQDFSISVVLSGSFTYAGETGRALLHPGALLLGNRCACYHCSHDHSTGDHCLSVRFEQDYFYEVAATVAGSSAFRFPVAALPAARSILPHLAVLQANGEQLETLEKDETIARFLCEAISTLSGKKMAPQKASRMDERRISRALRHMERHSTEALDLAALARVAGMSKFHFLRVFRQTTTTTPYQYLLNLRLRAAAHH
ncbi:MAG: helix-turn-helix transcriptional regulator [Beijerinckiaceae bacterium]